MLELFLWEDKEEIAKEINNNSEYKNDIEYELFDVLIYYIQIENTLELDIKKIFISLNIPTFYKKEEVYVWNYKKGT